MIRCWFTITIYGKQLHLYLANSYDLMVSIIILHINKLLKLIIYFVAMYLHNFSKIT